MKDHKKIVLVACIIMPMLYAFDQGHNFEYYKTKTIELLPVLGIDPSIFSFTVVGHTVTIEERQENPYVVFINVEKLNTYLSTRQALFECLIEAQLSCMSEKTWSSFVPVERPSRADVLIDYLLLLPLACYCFKWVTQRSPFPLSQEISFMIVTLMTTAASIGGFSFLDEQPTVSKIIENNFEQKKFFIQLDTIHKLFNSYTHAPIAVHGAMVARIQYSHISARGNSFELKEAITNMSHAFDRWAQAHPDAYEKILLNNSITV